MDREHHLPAVAADLGHLRPARADFQLVEKVEWFAGFDINYHVGIDGISLFLVLLSTLITLVCVIVSWQSIQYRVKEYMVAFLVMETFMVGVFCALDLVLFYLFFEGILIPMFLIIGIWGGPRGSTRRSSSSCTRCSARCCSWSRSW